MTRTLNTAFVTLALVAGVWTASAAEPSAQGMRVSQLADMRLAEGIVRKVDKAAGKVTLAHGPLPNGMPGMTMAFKAADASRLDGIRAGQTVRFALDDAMTIVRLEQVGRADR